MKAVTPATARTYALSELDDVGDFYILNTGERASFYRVKGTYLAIYPKRTTTGLPQRAETATTLLEQTTTFLQSPFPQRSVMFRIKEDAGRAATIRRFYGSDSDIEFISPLLTSRIGGRGIALMPSLVVSLKSGCDNDDTISELERKYGLSLVSRLAFSDSEYEFKINDIIEDVGRIFKTTREIAGEPFVAWAEPNFLTSVQMQRFIPNDTLFTNQWHLDNARDADVDAPEGWEISTGANTVIAVLDDGIDLGHPDLSIWSNPGETGFDVSRRDKRTNGVDDDRNGYIDDHQGWNFVNRNNNPGPVSGLHNHGTAVAGVAAAIGNNGRGVTGSAPNAVILPIRISTGMSCPNFANSMRYGGMYADVISNSWGLDGDECRSNLNTAIADVVGGNMAGARRGAKGSPVLFAAGNAASGWRKYSVRITTAGSYTFRWRFMKDASGSEGYDTVWLDDVTWPGGATEDFNGEITGGVPDNYTSTGSAIWSVVNDPTHARGIAGKSVRAGTISHGQQTDLERTRTVSSGDIVFWVWVSCEEATNPPAPDPSVDRDLFEFYIGDSRQRHYAPGHKGLHKNSVRYPASNPDTIAVGSSNDGLWSGQEERSYYSQFGGEIDILAPSSGGVNKITTTDRLGAVGYNTGAGGDLADTDYTQTFGGTSSATPLAAGIVASLISRNSNVTAAEVRTMLHHGTDKIGPRAYISGRNDYYGYGKINFPLTVGQMWVDFSHSGQEYGSPDREYNTLAEGVSAVSEGGVLLIRSGTTAEATTITKGMIIKSVGGPAIIGQTPGG